MKNQLIYLLLLILGFSTCTDSDKRNTSEYKNNPRDEISLKKKYLDKRFIGIWRLYSTLQDNGSENIQESNHYLTLKDDGTYLDNINSKYIGMWFCTKGYLDAMECDLIVLMRNVESSRYDRNTNEYHDLLIRFSNNSLTNYQAKFIENNGTNQLELFDLGSQYNAGEKYRFTKL